MEGRSIFNVKPSYRRASGCASIVSGSFSLASIIAAVLTVGFDGDAMAQQPRHEHGAEARAANEITPADVFVLVKQVQAELELLRLEIGKPLVPQTLLRVSEATPREVYFGATSLLEKASSLTVEYECEMPLPEFETPNDIRPANVARLVKAALDRLRAVKTTLGITEGIAPIKRDASKQPSDVLTAILQTNRQLNAVLDHPVRPKDVYRKVSLALRYVSEISWANGIGELSLHVPYERRKQPLDAYPRLLDCFKAIQEISAANGIRLMKVEVDQTALDSVQAADVYDVASLVVAELKHLNSTVGSGVSLREYYYPGWYFSAHVSQKAVLLKLRIQRLEITNTASGRAFDNGGDK